VPSPASASSPVLPDTFEAFLATYQEDLAREVLRRMPPVYDLTAPLRDPEVARLLRQPFRAQYHAAKALAHHLEAAKAGFLVAEPSAGKTMAALTAAALLHATRVLVIGPSHLMPKWRREIQSTIRGARVFDLQRIRDLAPIMAYAHTPLRPVFVLLARDQAKLGAPWRHAARPSYLRTVEPSSVAVPRRVPIVRGAEASALLQTEPDGSPTIGFACPRCGMVLHDAPTPEEAARGGKVRPWTAEDFADIPRACPGCGERLVQQHRLRGSTRGVFPLARYLARRYRGAFDLVILDELHQFKGRDTGQGMMLSELEHVGRRTLALTATLMSGRASSLFYLLHRTAPDFRDAWGYDDETRFARTYGLHEVTHFREQAEHGTVTAHGKRSKAKTVRTHVRELPGVSPLILRHVLDRTVVFHLSDLGVDLPPYRELAVEVALSQDQRDAYTRFLGDLQEHLAHGYRRRALRFLGASLQALLAWPDAPWRGDAIVEPTTEAVLATLPALPEDRLYPKEEQLISLCRASQADGRRTLCYCTHTQTRDITRRLQRLLSAHGLRADTLTSAVSGRRREAWIDRHAPGLDVLLVHPKLVGEGLDLIQFPDVIWMEPEYSTYTVRQASRRTWRIGQTQPVTVRFLVYTDTVQTQALGIVANGIRAASMVDGQVLPDDTLADYGGAEFILELAKSIVEGAPLPDVGAVLSQRTDEDAEAHGFLLPDDRGAASAPRIRELVVTHARPEQTLLFSA